MTQVVFVISLSSIFIIIVASLLAIALENFEFFPPPNKNAWQYRLFWTLFRVMFFGLIFLSFSTFGPEPLISNHVRYFLWLPLLILGFGAATYLSNELGWKNAHGEKGGLMVTGWYRWSRNPVYVVSCVGMIGWGMFVNSGYVSVILALWGFMYLLSPYVEEPWLESCYGEEYRDYKMKVPRFIGFPSA